jgi:hypothetical protein
MEAIILSAPNEAYVYILIEKGVSIIGARGDIVL